VVVESAECGSESCEGVKEECVYWFLRMGTEQEWCESHSERISDERLGLLVIDLGGKL
jgi:hypothetical protein